MPNVFLKEILKEIKFSLGRFLSILSIVAIGVAFFSGIKASAPDMKNSADSYFDKYNVQDLQIYSTLGLTDEDINAIQKLKNVEAVQGSFSMDTLSQIDSSQMVIKVISFQPNQTINKIRLVNGRIPKKDNECLVEASSATNKLYGSFKIGDTITLESGTSEDLNETLKNTKYTIVGTCYNPNYLSYEKGSSSIGSGSVSSFIYVNKSNILVDYYTELDVTVKGAKELDTYSDDYFNLIKPVKKKIKKLANKQIKLRIQSQQDNLNKEKINTNSKLFDAKAQLDEAQAQIDSAKSQIKNNENTLQASKAQLDSGWTSYNEGVEALKNLPTLNEAISKIEESEKQLPVLQSQLEQIQNGVSEIEATKEQLLTKQASLLAQKQLLEQQLNHSNISEEQKLSIQSQLSQLEQTLSSIDQGIDLYENLETVQNGISQINDASQQKTALIDQRNQLLSIQEQLNQSYSYLVQSQAQYESGIESLKQAQFEIKQNENKLNSSIIEYNEQKENVDNQFSEAQEKIDSLIGKWIVLDRNSHYSYRDYEACADRMDGIAKVFPVFFFLVAALVCMTTMTRMVDEQRNEIGTLKALGYSKIQISCKYLIYAFFASILGSIIGCGIGMYLFPTVIFNAWNTLYNLEQIRFLFQPSLICLSSGSVTLITLLATLYSIHHELVEVPSQLMRPKAIRAGKKILLEKIPIIWNHLPFLRKVTARNLFRYKKRFFMTIIGIAGCSALLVAGFGINDSISDIVHQQYDVIYHYDASISTNETSNELTKAIKNIDGVKNIYEEDNLSVTSRMDKKDISTTVHIISDKKNFTEFITLFNGKETLSFNDKSVFISQKMADKLRKKVGDTITLKDANNKKIKIKITGIFTNYVGHHVYVSKSLYESWNSSANISHMYLMKSDKKTKAFERKIGNKIMKLEGVNSVTFYSSLKKNFKDMISSISYIVVVLVISAASLAFVVLYNLSNVNISERKREIATIKVLGFTKKEVDAYVNRETILLTILGSLLGLIIGIGLHHLIMNLAEMDDIMFGRTINKTSFLISFLLTISFSIIINFFMRFKLNRIEMVESLKAVE